MKHMEKFEEERESKPQTSGRVNKSFGCLHCSIVCFLRALDICKNLWT